MTEVPHHSRNYSLICLILFLIFVMGTFFLPFESGDNWWHLATGRFIAGHKSVPAVDPFPGGALPQQWIFTQWLGSLFFYLVFYAAGLPGIITLRVLIFLIIFLLFLWHARKSLPLPLSLILAFTVLFGVGLRWHMRPYIFNFIFIQLFLMALTSYQRDHAARRLAVIPLMGIVWFNLHLGSFIYGSTIIGIFLLYNVFMYKTSLRPVRDLALCLAGFWCSFLVNPYGLKGFLYPFRCVLDPSYIDFYRELHVTAEQAPPVFLFSPAGAWVFVLAGAFAWLFTLNKKRSILHVLLFVFPLFMFVHSQRASAFFALMAGYVIIDLAKDFPVKQLWQKYEHRARLVNVIFIAVLLVNIAHAAGRKSLRRGQTVRQMSFTESYDSPGDAVAFLQEQGLAGPVMNSVEYGGYLLMKAYPAFKPFIDGRYVDRDRWHFFQRLLQDPDTYWPAAEQHYGITIVLLTTHNRAYDRLIQVLHHHPGWQLILVDGYAVCFVKKGVYHLSEDLLDYEKNSSQVRVNHIELEKAIADHESRAGYPLLTMIRNYIDPPYYYIDHMAEGLTFYELGFEDMAIAQLLKSAQYDRLGISRKMVSYIIQAGKPAGPVSHSLISPERNAL